MRASKNRGRFKRCRQFRSLVFPGRCPGWEVAASLGGRHLPAGLSAVFQSQVRIPLTRSLTPRGCRCSFLRLRQLWRWCSLVYQELECYVNSCFLFLDKPLSRPFLADSEARPAAARGCHGHQACVARVEGEC